MSNYNYEVEDEDGAPFNWIHFEGRNAQEVSKMIDYIDSKDWRSRAIVSVELEKPYRKGLEILMNKSDGSYLFKDISFTLFDKEIVTITGPKDVSIPIWRTRVLYVPQRPPIIPGTPLDYLKKIRSFKAQQKIAHLHNDPIEISS
ncbi:15968_t:CDS:2, partial [Entrophospora sp. SA101]